MYRYIRYQLLNRTKYNGSQIWLENTIQSVQSAWLMPMNKNNNEPSPQVELQGKVLRQQHIRAVITLQADSVVLPQYGILGDARYEFRVIKRKEITIP